ncbi:hypothetical protein [Mucilaginibacter aquatilis]|uniref:DUF3300 domain-containing protein n=1 Tax=Mucilaginibacter aquatilis TaxID=1517760 RepID=A0A6I4I8G5_9SPHI|nr:hypothetical protein [Mucilaginibacter aquatilis]MVN91352.1 hypothetical protein [Mucilaginibacter aquatilis]
MKKYLLTIIIAAGAFASQTANAQIGISVNIGPVGINMHRPVATNVVYDDFYYLPDVEAYYSVPEHCYYYMDGNRWVNAAYLPGYNRDYDWRSARRIEVHARRPFDNHGYYRNKFGGNSRRDWNRSWNNGRDYNRGNRAEYGNRYLDSPFDSNNRGRNDQRNNGYQNGSNRWNDRRDDNRNRGNDNKAYGPDRNQGGYLRNESRNENYNRRNGNENNRRGQRFVENDRRDSRPDLASVNRVAF